MTNIETLQCSQCGYDLAGLPGAGQCPECGQTYDTAARDGVHNPFSPAARAQERSRRTRLIGFIIAAVVVMSCAGLISLRGANYPTWLALGGIASLGLIAWGIYEYAKGDKPK